MTGQHVIRFEDDSIRHMILDEKHEIVSGAGPHRGDLWLVGFSQPDDWKAEVLAEAAIEDPTLVAGLWPILTDGENLSHWAATVRTIEPLVLEPYEPEGVPIREVDDDVTA